MINLIKCSMNEVLTNYGDNTSENAHYSPTLMGAPKIIHVRAWRRPLGLDVVMEWLKR